MRRSTSCIPVAIVALVLVSCAEDALPPIEATLDFELHAGGDDPPTVSGTTNLPPGTALTVSLDEHRPAGTSYSVKCNVEPNGTFRTPPLAEVGELLPGNYLLSVVMPVPLSQSAEAQQRLGSRGERLSGPLVQQTGYGAVVRKERAVAVGGKQAAAVQRERAAREVEELEALQDEILFEKRELDAAAQQLAGKDPAEDLAWRAYGAEVSSRFTDLGNRIQKTEGVDYSGVRPLFVSLLKLFSFVEESDGLSYGEGLREFVALQQRVRRSLEELRKSAGLPPRPPESIARPPRAAEEGPPPPPLPITVDEDPPSAP